MTAKRPSFPHIGWDPTPGDIEETQTLAKRLGSLASELGTAATELERIECGAWKGKTAVAFSEYVGHDVAPLIRKSHESFDKASRALHRWAGELKDFQDEADRLEKLAGEKLEARDKAQAKAGSKGSDELGEASGDVDAVIAKVHDLEERYRKAAGEIGKQLDKAAGIAPDEPGFWSKLGKGIADAWDSAGDWLKDHADLIKAVGDILSDVTAVLGVLAIATLPFPPLAAIFGAAALIGSGLALAAHGVAMASGADVSWLTLGTDALGLMPGIGMFGRGAKIVGKSAEAAEGTAKATAGLLGKGFQITNLGESGNLLKLGKSSQYIKNGLGIKGLVKIGGSSEFTYEVSHAGSALRSRIGGLVNAGYMEGQWAGTKGLGLVGVNLDPVSGIGRAIDGSLKIAPKVVTNIKDAVSGD